MKYLKQFALICLFCAIGQIFSIIINNLVPGNVIAMVLLLLALCSGFIKEEVVKDVGDFFLANMAFFFVPITVLSFFNLVNIADQLIKLLVICILTTIIAAVATGYTVSVVVNLLSKVKKEV